MKIHVTSAALKNIAFGYKVNLFNFKIILVILDVSRVSLKLKVELCSTCVHVDSREPSLSSHSVWDSSGES